MLHLFLLLAILRSQPVSMTLTSPAFKHNAPLPVAYTGYGEFKSPPLTWSGAPANTREFVLTVDDPDVPLERFSVHWVLYDIPPSVTSLPATAVDRELRAQPAPVKGATQGLNAMKWIGYLPPRPFAGSGLHHYVFTLHALNADVSLPPGATKDQVMTAIKGHVIAEARLIAVFESAQ